MDERKTLTHISNAVFIVSVIIAVIAAVSGFFRFRSGLETRKAGGSIVTLLDGWDELREDGSIEEFTTFRKKLDKNEITLSRIFVFELGSPRDTLNFEVRNAAVEIYQDGFLLASTPGEGAPDKDLFIGTYEVSQKLDIFPGSASEIVIHLRSSSPLSVEYFYFGNAADIAFRTISDAFPTIIFVVASFFMCAIVFLIMYVGRRKGMVLRTYYYLLIFVLICSVWLVANLDFFEMLGASPTLLALISYESFLLIPIAIALYMYNTFRSIRMADIVMIGYSFLLFAVLNILHFTRMMTFIQSFLFSEITVAACMLLAVVQSILEYRRNPGIASGLMIAGCIILLLGGVAQVLAFSFGRRVRLSPFFLISLLLFVFVQSMILVSELFKLVDEGKKAGDYLSMARTDPLTGLGNRRALEFYISEISKSTSQFLRIGCIVCDLNGLKKTNDTYGHTVGDQMIKDFANCLSVCFENRGVPFRSGGDEFYILFSDVEVDMSAMMRRLMIGIEGSNTASEYKLSCSSGCYADYVAANNEAAIWDVIKLADAEMYKQKKKDREAAAESRS